MTVTSVKISLASMGVCAGLGAFGEAELEADVISLGLNQAYSEREKFEERRKPPAFSGVC